MKTPVWIPNFLLALACVSPSLAQTVAVREQPIFSPLPTPLPGVPPSAATAADNISQPGSRLSHYTAEIVRLAQSGIEDSVILAFIDASGAFQLRADQIVYLNDLGVSSEVVAAMLQRDRAITATQTPASIPSIATVPDATRPDFSLENLSSTNANTTSAAPQTILFTEYTGLAAATNEISPTGTNTVVADDPVTSSQTVTLASTALSGQSQPPQEKRRIFYPVRAPYPVELTAPIIFLEFPHFQ
jgi:hypothetical protein